MTLDVRARVVLIDDHPLVRLGLCQVISTDPAFAICGEAASPIGALALMREVDPDIAVLDLMLTDGRGLDVINQVLCDLPHLKILVVSMHDQRVYAERCLRCGAKGYLMKDEAADLVLHALHAINAGGIFLSPTMTASPRAHRAPIEALSDRELEVFELIGDGLPTRVIASRLSLSDKTVEAHKAHIKTKLGIRHGSELLHLALAWRESGR